MKRPNLWAFAMVPFALAACGPGTVEVNAELEFFNPETGDYQPRPVENLEVQLVPFDRDAIFDSLTAAAPRPEPGFPAELQVMQDSLFAAQETQRQAESEWLALRERLQQITREMEQYSRAEGQYLVLFRESEQLFERVAAAERRQTDAFRRVEELQSRVLGDLNVARLEQEAWEDEAFEDYFDVVARRVQALRRDIAYDTTNAQGMAAVRVPPGDWWVHARYTLPTEELYWNIRVNVERGDPIRVFLSRENAEPRRIF
jgi:hypothetical protein